MTIKYFLSVFSEAIQHLASQRLLLSSWAGVQGSLVHTLTNRMRNAWPCRTSRKSSCSVSVTSNELDVKLQVNSEAEAAAQTACTPTLHNVGSAAAQLTGRETQTNVHEERGAGTRLCWCIACATSCPQGPCTVAAGGSYCLGSHLSVACCRF
jgi:hypothetical protein